MQYIVQAMTSSVANHGETLAPLMRAAGFRYVFLGNREHARRGPGVPARLGEERQSRRWPPGRQRHVRAIDCCIAHGIYVVGGIIVGNPNDTGESIETNLAFARR